MVLSRIRCVAAPLAPLAALVLFMVPLALAAQSQDPRSGGAPGLRPAILGPPASETIGGGTTEPDDTYQLDGIASWYGGKFQGRLTANGETFDTNQLTAAHRELPFGTIVRVTNMTNKRSVVVRINDRGPFVDNRVIDLSRAAADIIEMTAPGIAPVTLEILHYEPESDLRTLQVASFGAPANARALAERLIHAGVSAAIEEDASLGVHRVIIPDIPEGEIPHYLPILGELGYGNPLVRRR